MMPGLSRVSEDELAGTLEQQIRALASGLDATEFEDRPDYLISRSSLGDEQPREGPAPEIPGKSNADISDSVSKSAATPPVLVHGGAPLLSNGHTPAASMQGHPEAGDEGLKLGRDHAHRSHASPLGGPTATDAAIVQSTPIQLNPVAPAPSGSSSSSSSKGLHLILRSGDQQWTTADTDRCERGGREG